MFGQHAHMVADARVARDDHAGHDEHIVAERGVRRDARRGMHHARVSAARDTPSPSMSSPAHADRKPGCPAPPAPARSVSRPARCGAAPEFRRPRFPASPACRRRSRCSGTRSPRQSSASSALPLHGKDEQVRRRAIGSSARRRPAFTASATASRCSAVSSGNIGSDSTSAAAARSAGTGRPCSPGRRRPAAGGSGSGSGCRSGCPARSALPATLARFGVRIGVDVIDVARLVRSANGVGTPLPASSSS